MIDFNPNCHTLTGHLFHSRCHNLSESKQKFYSIASKVLSGITCGYAQRVHHQWYHSETHLSLHERVSLISSHSFEQPENLTDTILEKVCGQLEQLRGISLESEGGWQQLLTSYVEEEDKLIALLCTLKGTNPWNYSEVIAQFDLVIQLAFLAGVRNLEIMKDHPDCVKAQQRGSQRAFAEAMTTQGRQNYRIFFLVPKLYELARGCQIYEKRNDLLLMKYLKTYYEGNKDLFYKAGTKQEEWRDLYNSYCRIVYSYAREEDFNETDDRFSIHTKEDHHPCAYDWNVGTAPS